MTLRGAGTLWGIASRNHATFPARRNLTATRSQSGFPHSRRHFLTHTIRRRPKQRNRLLGVDGVGRQGPLIGECCEHAGNVRRPSLVSGFLSGQSSSWGDDS
jgi:hypothetical protein